jgi:hypothetical protein
VGFIESALIESALVEYRFLLVAEGLLIEIGISSLWHPGRHWRAGP